MDRGGLTAALGSEVENGLGLRLRGGMRVFDMTLAGKTSMLDVEASDTIDNDLHGGHGFVLGRVPRLRAVRRFLPLVQRRSAGTASSANVTCGVV